MAARTLMSRFGFQDPDLVTQEHDEIMYWLHGKARELVKWIKGWDPAWTYRDVMEIANKHGQRGEDWSVDRFEEFHTRVEWEHVIMSGTYAIGFIDMRVTYEYDRLSLTDAHVPILGTTKGAVCFEVKTAIPSLGEMIRQINLYRRYVQDPFCVVSGDDRFIRPLNLLGIGFVHYPSAEVFQP